MSYQDGSVYIEFSIQVFISVLWSKWVIKKQEFVWATMVACIGGTRICFSHIQVLDSFIKIIKMLELCSLAAWGRTCQHRCKIHLLCEELRGRCLFGQSLVIKIFHILHQVSRKHFPGSLTLFVFLVS